jgi:hypothetical protein
VADWLPWDEVQTKSLARTTPPAAIASACACWSVGSPTASTTSSAVRQSKTSYASAAWPRRMTLASGLAECRKNASFSCRNGPRSLGRETSFTVGQYLVDCGKLINVRAQSLVKTTINRPGL